MGVFVLPAVAIAVVVVVITYCPSMFWDFTVVAPPALGVVIVVIIVDLAVVCLVVPPALGVVPFPPALPTKSHLYDHWDMTKLYGYDRMTML